MNTEFIHIARRTEFLVKPNMFPFRNDRPHAWLQRLCIRILRKLGCYALKNIEVETKRIDRDIDPIIEYLHRQKFSVLNVLDRFEDVPLHLLIGSKEWHKVCRQTELHPQYFSYAGELSVCGGRYGRGQLIGMTVHVIPWMTGALVVPRLD